VNLNNVLIHSFAQHKALLQSLSSSLYTYIYTSTSKYNNKEAKPALFLRFLSFEDLKRPVFWDITPRSSLKANENFGGTCNFHHQGQRLSKKKSQQHHAGVLLGLLFSAENGSDMFLRNVS
jgi:hypothetical protein